MSFRVAALLWLLSLSVSAALAAPSPGCGRAPEAASQTLLASGVPRSFTVSLPEPYEPGALHALVVAFHGRTSPAEVVRRYYDLEPHAQTLGRVIFVYPEALRQTDGTFGWWDAGDPPHALRDFAFFDALLKTLGEHYCLDLSSVYAVGHSLGGSFVNALGCHRAAALRGVASLGSGPSAGRCEGQVAAVIAHNPEDRLVPFEGGEEVLEQRLVQNGLAPSGLSPSSVPASDADAALLNCRVYGDATPYPVMWCPHTVSTTYDGRYYPHTWPSTFGGVLMTFFAALP